MISSHQAEKGRNCLRRWLFDWYTPFDQRAPQTPEAALGEQIHNVAQDYHERGQKPDVHTVPGQMFLPALRYLPRPLVGRCEGEFHMQVAGIEYTGYIDLECRSDDLPGAPGGYPAVVDYKTKKKLKGPGVMEGPGDFLNNEQALIYAARTLVRHKAQAVLLRWVYLKREGKPGARAVDALLTREEVNAAFGRIIHPVSRVLVTLKLKRPDPLILPARPDSCERYGPKWACPHQDKCNLSSEDKLLGLEDRYPTEKEMNDLLKFLDSLPDNTKASDAVSAPATEGTQPSAAEAPKGINPPEGKTQAQPAHVQQAPKTVDTLYESLPNAPSDAEIGRVIRFLCGR